MNPALLARLSHLHAVSGEVLARDFGCTRAAINKQVEQCREAGVLIEARPRQGYRYAHPYQWWSGDRLRTLLPAWDVHVLPDVDSTNRWLFSVLDGAAARALAISDFQSGGRGRRGRDWLSPPGRQIAVSWGICSSQRPQVWMGLALAAGVVLAEALRARGVPAQLKWPNDIEVDGAKLGGILVELEAVMDGPSRIVIGLGLNEALLPVEREALARPVTTLAEHLAGYDRHELLTELSLAIQHLVERYPDTGLTPWLARWQGLDALVGKAVRFQRGEDWDDGVAQGVDGEGRLIVATPAGVVHCHSGEVSVRVG